MNEKEIVDKLKDWVEYNYNPRVCGWTAERSMGNYDDCFSDGSDSGLSWAAYEVGRMLGMELEEPDEVEY